jgi:3-oxoacyl-[acyl-carrier-protein] synthase II
VRRVVITAAGSWNALGAGVAAFLEGLRTARCAIGEMTLFATEGYRTRRAAVAPDTGIEWLPRALVRRLSRSDRMALECVREAWRAVGLGDCRLEPPRGGVAIGGTTGGMLEAEERHRRATLASERLGAPILLSMPVHATADAIATTFDLRGPRLTVATACSSSVNAIGLAADAIQEDRADVMIAGGTEAHCKMTFAGFNALQAIDPDVCRPFDRRRAGLSLGEGAAILVLEEEGRARRRGATILAEIAGYGVSADAHHMTAPDPEGRGAVLAMSRALAEAKTAPGDVDYVNAHGTGTPHNDPIETRAIRSVFGEHAGRLAVSSTKSQVGHCLGAAGAIETLATVLAIRHGFVPPTVNLEETDPECDLDYVPRSLREARVRVALSNSYGFGGNNASICLREYAG